jgi:plasmid stability protein
MEAEARDILAKSLSDEPTTAVEEEAVITARRKRIVGVVGIWKDRMGGKTTDEIMKELRGDD